MVEIWERSPETHCEKKMRAAFEQNGIGYRQEERVGPYMVDFIVGEKVAVEVDGYVHLSSDAARRDSERLRFLEDLGYTVLRVDNDSVRVPRLLKQFIERVKREIAEERERMKEKELRAMPFDNPRMNELRDSLLSREAKESKRREEMKNKREGMKTEEAKPREGGNHKGEERRRAGAKGKDGEKSKRGGERPEGWRSKEKPESRRKSLSDEELFKKWINRL